MTVIGNKKQFLAFIEKNVADDQIVVLTTEVKQTAVRKKLKAHQVDFLFAADAFNRPDGVGHIAFGETIAIAFQICPQSDIAENKLPEAVKSPDFETAFTQTF